MFLFAEVSADVTSALESDAAADDDDDREQSIALARYEDTRERIRSHLLEEQVLHFVDASPYGVTLRAKRNYMETFGDASEDSNLNRAAAAAVAAAAAAAAVVAVVPARQNVSKSSQRYAALEMVSLTAHIKCNQ